MEVEINANRILLKGEVYLQDAEILIHRLKEILYSSVQQICIDLNQVTAIDTAILQILLSARKSAHQLGHTLVCTSVSEVVERALKHTGLDSILLPTTP